MSSAASSSTAPSLSGGGKLTPNLDQRSTKMLNLTVLQRVDPFIEEILITAGHVTFYEFNIDLNQWSRKEIEGSLFVVKRNTQPRFQFIVMNRRNTENLVEDLMADFEYEVQVPYLLYRNNATQEVNGIWFYNSLECEEVANLFSRILNAYSKVAPKSQVTPRKSEFEELEAVPTSAVIEGPLEPSVTPGVSTVGPDDPTFVNFFSMAMNTGHSSSNDVNSGQFYHNIAPSAPPSHVYCATPSRTLTQQGYSSSNDVNSEQFYHNIASTAPPSHVYGATPSHAPTQQVPSFPVTSPSVLSSTQNDVLNSVNNSNRTANLVKPSSFYTPPPSLLPYTPPMASSGGSTSALHPILNHQSSHDTPMLQPFPPPTPPLSLAANPGPTAVNVPLNKEKVRDALLMLVQDDQFIDMVHRALMKVHRQS